jgi:hypothetical protein
MLAHLEQELDPLSYHHWGEQAAYHICRELTAYLLSHQKGSCPFVLSAWPLEIKSTRSPQQGWSWTSAVDTHKQPNPEPVALGKCTLILLSNSCPAILSFGMLTQMIIK